MVSREPICARILLEYLGTYADTRARLAECGLYSPQSGKISEAIMRAIDNDIPAHDFALRALPQ